MKNIYTLKINYKSGISQVIDVDSFKISGATFQWSIPDNGTKIIILGADHIESVYQLGYREVEE